MRVLWSELQKTTRYYQPWQKRGIKLFFFLLSNQNEIISMKTPMVIRVAHGVYFNVKFLIISWHSVKSVLHGSPYEEDCSGSGFHKKRMMDLQTIQ
jgi:hypothetical protein